MIEKELTDATQIRSSLVWRRALVLISAVYQAANYGLQGLGNAIQKGHAASGVRCDDPIADTAKCSLEPLALLALGILSVPSQSSLALAKVERHTR